MARFPDREALVDVAQGKRWTYAALLADVDTLARALLAIGVKTGDRVGIWAPNCSEWTLVQFATAKMGAILVNINPAYRSHELHYVLGQAGISTLIAAESFKTSNYREMVDEVRHEVPGLERVIYIGTEDWDSTIAQAGRVSESELSGIQASLKATDPINIQYTSGTTGFPKGATLSHRNILNNGLIPNLPDDAIVEVPGFLSGMGIQGLAFPALPEGIAELCRRELVRSSITVEAAAHGDKDLALQALLLDPMVTDIDTARAILDDFLVEFAEYLPQFAREKAFVV